MSEERIQFDLIERFAAPLPEFYQRRIIFWQDEDREFESMLDELSICLLYTSPSPRDISGSRMPSSA